MTGTEVYLGFLIGVVAQPAVGLPEVVKDMQSSIGGTGLEDDGGCRVHLCADPAAVEDVEDHHAEEEEGANQAHVPRKLLLVAPKQVEDAQNGVLCCCGLLAGPLQCT